MRAGGGTTTHQSLTDVNHGRMSQTMRAAPFGRLMCGQGQTAFPIRRTVTCLARRACIASSLRGGIREFPSSDSGVPG